MLFDGDVEESAAVDVKTSKRAYNLIFESLLANYKREFDKFWRNPNYTAVEMAAAWGTSAAALFARSAATKAYLLAVSPGCLTEEYLDPLMEITDNGDGTVTLS